jgi:hypothetical protein
VLSIRTRPDGCLAVALRWVLVATIIAFGLWIALEAQSVVANPRAVVFQCPDHDLDDNHEIDIVSVWDGSVLDTLVIGDPPADEQGDVTVAINVHPYPFGYYVVRVRAFINGVSSETSDSSPIWERLPGR